jgi:hypothetical protein
MGAGASTHQTAVAGDHHNPTGLDPPAPDRTSPARRQGLALGATLAKTVAHFFPELPAWLGETRDTRDQDLITYSRQFLLWMGLMAFLLKLGSRRQVRYELDSPEALANLNRLARGEQEAMAHSDTLNYFPGHVPPASLTRPRRRMAHRLVRMKALRPDTVVALANLGGRCRWKIENEGFNIQKNGGFNLEHAYSTGEWQIKNFYVLLQLAHLFLQLVERGSLLTQEAKKLFGSLRGMARRLAESIRNVLILGDALDPKLAATIQIRLNSS